MVKARSGGLQCCQKSQWLKFLLILALFTAICVLPLCSQLYAFSRRTVTVEQKDIQLASVKDTVVSQRILLQGRMDNLKIFFYAPSGRLYGNAAVTIAVTQEGARSERTVKAQQLLVGGAYEIPKWARETPVSKKESMYQFRGKLSGFKPGWAEVSVVGTGLPEGTDLFCGVSRTLVSGLPSAAAGINDLGAPLVLEYDILKIDGAFVYETALLIALCAVGIFTAFLLSWKPDWQERYNLLFLCVFLSIYFFVSIRQPMASLRGEPRSEAAYEFWYKAHEWGFFRSLMSLMSGEALAWMERILIWAADKLSPVRYVFVAAQLLELTFISFVTAMPAFNAYRRYFSDEVRMAFSLFLGTALLFVKAYFFWSVSYWSLLFFIAFALLDLERLKRWQYGAGLALTAVLCVSRIFHAVLIPVALLLAAVLGKKCGRRFRGYCYTAAAASSFEMLYSLLAGQHLSGSVGLAAGIKNLGIGRILFNTLYFQLQALNSFFTAKEHFLGGISNAIFFCIWLLLAAYALQQLFKKDGNKPISCFLLSLGFISFGTIAATVVTSGSYDWVSMPYNYSAQVNWGENYYQEGDLHFAYAYICIVYLLMGGLFFAKEWLRGSEWFASMNSLERRCTVFFGRFLTAAVFVLLCMIQSPSREIEVKVIPTEWQAISHITKNDRYFAAINAWYGVAPISLEHHSDEMIYGVDKEGRGMLWDPNKPAYEEDAPYHTAGLGAISDLEDKEILSVTARRALTNFDVCYIAVFRDADGQELARIRQANSPERIWLDFIPEEPLKGVYSISFELEDGNMAYIQDGLQVGYAREDG
ncbi:MAG: hypothetical protein HFG26_06460 [Provencibacterium sp.]|jgi:hypothetical protein|nr:hypothetical protein [Provencibacterium sp.]